MSRLAIVNQAMLDVYGRDRGTGTALPATDLRRGDVYQHTTLGLHTCTGTAWRQTTPLELTAAQRTALATGGLHPGFEVVETDTGRSWTWNGAWAQEGDAPGAWTSITLATPWVSYVGAGPAPSSGPYDVVAYRVENGRVWLRGWGNPTAATTAQAAINSVALPAAVRPSKGRTIWPTGENTSTLRGDSFRVEVYTDGLIYPVRAVPANSFLNFDHCSYPLI